jgi:hypothetical protein
MWVPEHALAEAILARSACGLSQKIFDKLTGIGNAFFTMTAK